MRKLIAYLITGLSLSFNSYAEVIAKGEFVGMSGREAKGQLSIEKTDDGYKVHFAENFWFDGAPDPRLGFGQAKYFPKTEFAKLSHLKGEKSYSFVSDANLEQYQSFWIWCEAFSVPIGKVELKKL